MPLERENPSIDLSESQVLHDPFIGTDDLAPTTRYIFAIHGFDLDRQSRLFPPVKCRNRQLRLYVDIVGNSGVMSKGVFIPWNIRKKACSLGKKGTIVWRDSRRATQVPQIMMVIIWCEIDNQVNDDWLGASEGVR